MGSAQYTVVEENATNNEGFNLTKVEGATGAGSLDNPNPINDVRSATASGTVGTEDTTVTFTNTYSSTGTFDPDGDITPNITKQILGYGRC